MSSSKSSSRDFSYFSLFTAGLACLIPLTSAYTQPKGTEPKGNPIYEPTTGSIVPAGQDFAVTWKPTTAGTVTILLLKGPSTNAVAQYPIAQDIPNSGKFIWVPSTDLAPGTTGYGLQLIDDATGQYQYSTQFGISNPDYHGASASASSSGATATGTQSTSSGSASKPTGAATRTESSHHHHTNTWSTAHHTAPANGTATSSPTTSASTPPAATTPAPVTNTTSLQPTTSAKSSAATLATSLGSFVIALCFAVLAV